ncbi:Transcriptional regulator [Castellaniella defragrans 65Phen]|uniref:Transcriptional regulator n=2 Tax=Castellaniella defragrans TaxID=75697 RepID=W8WWX3_CASD6|nr:Transcriptional regulator [Castellaniella defragrans 65Phen]
MMGFYDDIRADLLAGRWERGQRLPSIRAMAAQRRASLHTVVSAYGRLVGDGLLEAQQGRGYFVAVQGPLAAPAAPAVEPALPDDPLFRLLQAPPGSVVKLGCGWLPLPWRDTDLLARAIRRTARLGRSGLVEYGDIQGYVPLRQLLSAHLRQAVRLDAAPAQMITTLGATQALDLVARHLLSPGDRVLVDEPCNGNLVRLIRLCGGEPVGVPRRQDGPDLGFLDEVLARHRVRAFFCNSTFHNPTGAGLTPQAAFGVLRRAVEHDFLIVEDDVYGDFHPGGRQTFAELDGLERVVYIGSFSKSLSASLRIGYLACPQDLVAPLVRLKLLTSVAVPGFCERFVHTILADGTYLRHVRAIQRRLATQQQLTQKALRERGWRFEVAPAGGMFLWAGHPDLPDLAGFIEGLEKKGILLLPGPAFAVTADYRAMTRINAAHFSPELARAFRV